MEKRLNSAPHYRILGLLTAFMAYPFMAVSIAFSPWFNPYDNALSDLGNLARNGPIAWIFNCGLILTGSFGTLLAIVIAIKHSSWEYRSWAMPFIATGIDLSLIGFFPEDSGGIHGLVSLLFFGLIAITMLIYSYSSWPLGSPRVGAVALAFGIACPLVWLMGWPWHGVAIQETLTSAMMAVWLIMVSMRNL